MFNRLLARYPFFFFQGRRRIITAEKTIFLTFDDGPTPQLTEQLLYILNRYNVKATFFCCGKNADDNLNLLALIEQNGHQIGYHSYSHFDICKTNPQKWLSDVNKLSAVSEKTLFRPPYGRILPSHYKMLKAKYQFVFWDVMSYDYKQSLSPEKILCHLEKTVRNGSIVVFHNNEKAQTNVLKVLPLFIQTMLERGYKFGLIV